MKETDKEHQEIGKELEDLPECIWPFTYIFNKKKFVKLLERREQDYKINVLENMPKELNTKAYTIIVKDVKCSLH